MRKAQINSQVLVYILAIVITGIILIYGYKAIDDIRKQAQAVELITFKSDVRSAISTISTDYGSTKSRVFKIPTGFTELCFVNYDFQPSDEVNAASTALSSKYTFMKSMISSVIGGDPVDPKNTFLCPPCSQQDFVGNITLLDEAGDPAALRCFKPIGGNIRLTLEGLGFQTQIS